MAPTIKMAEIRETGNIKNKKDVERFFKNLKNSRSEASSYSLEKRKRRKPAI